MTVAPRLQPLTRARVATLGEAGRDWVEALPARLAGLEERWDLRLGRALPGGSGSYVARAERVATGEPVVVKVVIPDPGAERHLGREAAVLEAADGRGYALLHGYDAVAGALLLESLGPSAEQTPAPVEDHLARLAATLAPAWRLDLPEPARRPGEDRASSLHRLVVDHVARLGDVCPRVVLDRALTYAEELAASYRPEETVVVHGDPHPGNLLRVERGRPGAESGWAFVDPDGFRAEPAYDLGVLVRDWSGRVVADDDPHALVEGWCRLLADHTGVDEGRIWAWGFLERVSTGLYVTGFGAPAVGRPFLESAARLL